MSLINTLVRDTSDCYVHDLLLYAVIRAFCHLHHYELYG